MNDSPPRSPPSSRSPPPDVWLSSWETSIVNELESRHLPDLETESVNVQQKLWMDFQNTATSIAQLYVERGGQDTFRIAAFQATNLYKEGLESGRRLAEIAFRLAEIRRTKELLSWAKKRRRFIRRDELIGALAGVRKPKPPNPSNQTKPDHEDSLATFRAAVSSHRHDLATIINSEFQRKRSSSPSTTDVSMDSPPQKKSRFT